jgi:ankyrin repeat protein
MTSVRAGAVWWAARNGHLAVVLFLVDAGAHADLADADGNSAAHLAVAGGYDEILEVFQP